MKVSLVVPCYNEEGNVREFVGQARTILSGMEYELIFINDGSKDHTMQELRSIFEENPEGIKIINFSRNFGKEAGIYAGLQHAEGEYVVIIDADLQQPIEVAREMVEFLEENPEYDGVAAYQEQRKEGKAITWFKTRFYHIINRLCDVELYANASDFRCMRRNMADAILDMSEYHRFSKGIFAWVGFDVFYRPYQVRERNAGTTSWSFWKLVKYAIEGMVSFSTKPLKLATSLGLTVSALSIVYMIIVIIKKIAFGEPVLGYPTIVVLILLLGGIQLTVLGIIGEYLARVHIEVKNRPIYVAKEILGEKKSEE